MMMIMLLLMLECSSFNKINGNVFSTKATGTPQPQPPSPTTGATATSLTKVV